ncbi:hypothetical protein [Geodermatophilus marinus]|nr:hypothetical protein [Geodermatophilus sp. LHW52908]
MLTWVSRVSNEPALSTEECIGYGCSLEQDAEIKINGWKREANEGQ